MKYKRGPREHCCLLPCSQTFLCSVMAWGPPTAEEEPGGVCRRVGWAGPRQQHLAPCIASCQTPKEDLCSKFGMDLKRGMLLRLARQDPQLHPDNPKKRAAIYDRYKVRLWFVLLTPPGSR